MRRILLAVALLVLWASPAFATHVFNIPDFGASPTKTASTGNWNTAGTWTPSGVPSSSDIVSIPNGVTVTLDISNAVAATVAISGVFTCGTSGTKGITVDQIEVNEDGEFRCGTAASPFTGSFTLQFRSTCSLQTGTVMSPGVDPEQYGCGFLGFGKVYIVGVAKTPYVRLTAAPAAAATSLSLASIPTGWNSGDIVVLPDSTPRDIGGAAGGGTAPAWADTSCAGVYCKRFDRVALSATVTTTSASVASLTYAHPCGKNTAGTCEYYPHVANITRNIVIKSEDSTMMRGHILFTNRADVDIENTQIQGTGRTTIEDLNCTLFTTGVTDAQTNCVPGTGLLTRVGTNEKGRYGCGHFHHLYGPVNAGNTGYQFKFTGNACVDQLKWPVSIHVSSYGLVQNNVFAFVTGPAIVTEDGSEHYNLIDGNFCTGSESTKSPRAGGDFDGEASGGLESACVWGRGGTNNYVTNNIAAGMWSTFSSILAMEVGFKFFEKSSGTTVKIPNYRGADMTDVAAYTTATDKTLPVLQFEGNECYQMAVCFTVWNSGITAASNNALVPSMPVSTISDLVMWNIYEYGFFGYPINNYVFDGFIFRGEKTYTYGTYPQAFTSGDYRSYNVTLRNADVQGAYAVIAGTLGQDGPLLYENSTDTTDVGVEIDGYSTGQANGIPIGWGSGDGLGASPGTASRTITIRNVVHTASTLATTFWGWGNLPIRMCLRCTIAESNVGAHDYRYELPQTVIVEQYQGGSASFRIYDNERASEHWGGGLAPCTDTTTRPEIVGMTCPNAAGGSLRRRLRIRVGP